MIMAGLAQENQTLKNGIFEVFLSILAKAHAEDRRPEIAEAVSTALEAIKARNARLHVAVSKLNLKH